MLAIVFLMWMQWTVFDSLSRQILLEAISNSKIFKILEILNVVLAEQAWDHGKVTSNPFHGFALDNERF